ncbi:MAG: hypothetical protein FWC15_07555 [Fibromonadales bacterium]|nr:hypothetical protein [Fibromonadales bacterium]
MFKRLNVLVCASALLFLAACGGSKSSASYDDHDDEGGGGGRSGRAAPVRADELKDAQKDAVNLTEENHKMAREIFELKNKLGLSTDED